MNKKTFYFLTFIFMSTMIFAATNAGVGHAVEELMAHKMTLLVFQLSIIIFAAWCGGYLFNKMKLPAVLGEIVAGMIIGPYFLGHFPIFGFLHGVFPLSSGAFPVTPELYSYATVASIVLLFLVGLETDIKTFFKYSVAGSVIGVFGVVISFIFGDVFGIIFLNYGLGQAAGFFDVLPLFLGVISTATSVGITARILSEKKKMDSPEGVTILAAAVVDDVLGIILLAIIIGIAKSGHIVLSEVSMIGAKAVGIWLVFTVLGLIFAHKISGFLKRFKDRSTITIMALALAMFLAGIFEKSGLAMIIGAYVMGLSLSKTDLSLTIQENLHSLQKFYVPIFFCVMGMLVDITQMGSATIIKYGLLYVVFAVLGKLIGCMLPALFLNFNSLGALRIGTGMVPRGEVALIIVGIGLSAGILTKEIFSVALIMTFLTTLITPPILEKLFDNPKKGIRKIEDDLDLTKEEIVYDVPSEETADLLLTNILNAFEHEGFFVHMLDMENKIYQLRKDAQIISFKYYPDRLFFDCLKSDGPFIHTLFFEVLADLENTIKNLKMLTDKEQIAKEMFAIEDDSFTNNFDLSAFISPLAMKVNLKGNTKHEILEELVNMLIVAGKIEVDVKDEVMNDLIAREESMSTGMQNHLAFPHARTEAVKNLVVGIGVTKQGVDFESLDLKPAKLFIITLAPKDSGNPYLKFISDMSQLLATYEIDELTNIETVGELYNKLV
ncbi:MAG: PTS transporter subunit EIIA [bacterium]|nr:PTS transporter subunit EIIA [bacterium]